MSAPKTTIGTSTAATDAEAIPTNDLRHLAVIREPRTACGIPINGSLDYEGEWGVQWPFDDTRRLSYTTIRRDVTCSVCADAAKAGAS